MKRCIHAWRPSRAAALAMTLLASTVPLNAGEATSSSQPALQAVGGQTVSAPLAPAPPRPADLPYAVLADALLSELVRRADHPSLLETWAKERGFDPASSVFQELLAAALDVSRQHPWRLTQEEREAVLQRFAGDEEGLRSWRRQEKGRRYHAVGVAWGRWLEARRAEGHPPELMFERLLDMHPPTVLSASQGPAAELDLQRAMQAFAEGLRSVMQTLPNRLAW